jgi:hypothetical protein
VLKSIDSKSKDKSTALGLNGLRSNAPLLADIKNLHVYCCDSISKWSDPFRRHFYFDDNEVKSFLKEKLHHVSNDGKALKQVERK